MQGKEQLDLLYILVRQATPRSNLAESPNCMHAQKPHQGVAWAGRSKHLDLIDEGGLCPRTVGKGVEQLAVGLDGLEDGHLDLLHVLAGGGDGANQDHPDCLQ